MRKVAILIPGSPTPAFYSQISAISLALRKLTWSRWEPTIYAYFGANHGPEFEAAWHAWRPHLRDVEIIRVSEERFRKMDNWAQCDATIALAPRDADVLVAMDADTLPVRSFETVLDRVAESTLVAGVTAHYPVPPGATPYADWARWASGLGCKQVDFNHTHSLVAPDETEERRRAPFYLNGGVVFYARAAFDAFAPLYLDYRPKLMERMEYNDFSGQVAFTLAVAEVNLSAWALPMRYNFPNDPIAEELHPTEVDQVVIYHYLRTDDFDRQQIFTSATTYAEFLALPLTGINSHFQHAVRRILGDAYPFG